MCVCFHACRTYGNLTCEPYTAGGYCQPFLNGLMVVTNFSRSTQEEAVVPVDSIIQALTAFASGSDPQCVEEAVPLFCQYSFPPCDPAFDIPVYQRICRWDCEVMQEFYCSEVWEEMLQLLPLLDLGVIDVPNCGPLEYSDAGNAPTCISTLDGGRGVCFVCVCACVCVCVCVCVCMCVCVCVCVCVCFIVLFVCGSNECHTQIM